MPRFFKKLFLVVTLWLKRLGQFLKLIKFSKLRYLISADFWGSVFAKFLLFFIRKNPVGFFAPGFNRKYPYWSAAISAVTIVVLVLTTGWFAFFRDTQKASAAWWNDSWQYRKTIAVANSSGSVQTDFQVKVLSAVDLSADVTAGKIQASLNDLRFTDINGDVLSYWIEDTTNSSVDVWAKLPTIPTSGATIYMYYGNPNAIAGKTQLGSQANPGLSCKSIYTNGDSVGTGYYWVDTTNGSFADAQRVYCDMTNNGGGWMLVAPGMVDSTYTAYVTMTNTTDANGGISYNFVATGSGCGSGQDPRASVKITNSIQWDRVRSKKTLGPTGSAACWGEDGNGYSSEQNNLQAHDGAYDILQSCVLTCTTSPFVMPPMSRCDNADENFARSNAGSARIFESSARRINRTTVSGPGAGLSCNSIGLDWTISNVYIKEDSLLTANLSSTAPATEEKGTGPVAYWSFDEGYGTSAKDSTANKNNGTLTNMSATASSTSGWQSEENCVSGKCLAFDGGNDKIILTQATVLRPTRFTISSWIKPNTTGAYQLIVENYSQDGYVSGFQNHVTNMGNVSLTIGKNTGSTQNVDYRQLISSGVNVIDNKWHHETVTWDGTTMYVYIDGIERGSVTPGFDIAYNSALDNVRIGVNNYTGALENDFFRGSIDELKIYPYARSAAQIKMDYNVGLAGTGGAAAEGAAVLAGERSKQWMSNGLVGYWKMDETSWNGTSGEVADWSGNGNNGTGSGGVSTAAGKFGSGGSFDGSNDYFSIPDNALLDYGTGDFTISGWGYRNAGGGFFMYAYNPGQSPYFILFSYAEGNIQMWNSSYGFSDSGVNPGNNQWFHVAYMRQSGIIKFFINGVQAPNTYSITTNYTNTAGVWVGMSQSSEDTNGKIDDLRVYNRALSDREVRDLYAFAPGPVGYWNFEEGAGTIAYDTSGNGNTGTLTNGPTWTSGKYGKGVKFSGSSDYVEVSDNSNWDFTAHDGTVSFWVNHQYAYTKALVGQSHSGGDGNWAIFDGVNANSIAVGTNGQTPLTTPAESMPNGVWNHISVAKSGNTTKIYINGVEKASGTGTYFNNSSLALRFGWMNNGAFDGSMDDVKIYSYARSQKQIVEDMNGGHPAGGSPVGSQVGYWDFDEGYGTIAHDNSPQKNNATISGATWTNQGRFEKALSFDGNNDYVDVGTVSSYSFVQNTAVFTLGAWVKLKDYTTGDQAIMASTGTRSEKGFYLGYSSSNNKIIVEGYNQASPEYVFTGQSTGVIMDNNWHYVAVTGDGINVRIYVDGVQKGSNIALSGSLSTGDSSRTINIGRYNYSTPGNYFAGQIDEVKIYNYALSPDEIKIDYNKGSSMNVGNGITGDVSDDAVGWWKFDEGRGGTAANSGTTGSTNNGTLAGSTSWTTGQINGGASFNGSTDYVGVGTVTGYAGALTVEAWVNHASSAGWDDAVAGGCGDIIFGFAENLLSFGGQCNSPFTPIQYATPINGAWHHVAAVYAGGSGTNTYLYVDGVQVTSGSRSGSFTPGVLNIGSSGGAGAPAEFFTGKIDEVKIYNYARSASQIKADAATSRLNPVLPGAPVGEWKFEEGSGLTANDTSGNGNTGTWNGTGSHWTIGKVGKAGKFNGSDDYVDAGNGASLQNENGATIEAWIKTTSANEETGIVTKGTGVSEAGIALRIRQGIPGFSARKKDNSGYWDLFNGMNVLDGKWHHIAGSFDSSGGMKRYLDGKLEQSETTGQAFLLSAVNLKIGAGGHVAGNFNGLIDDVKYYDYARTPAQIAYDYNRGGPVGWWDMDECSGGIVHDNSGFGNNGTITVGGGGTQTSAGTCTTSGTAWGNGVSGKRNASLKFDGSDDYIGSMSDAKLPSGANPRSVALWVKPTLVDNNYHVIFEYGTFSANNLWGIGIDAGTNKYYISQYGYNVSGNVAQANVWTHLVVTYDGTTYKIYENGIQTNSGTMTTSTTLSGTMEFGRQISGTPYYFQGQLDDLRVYNYALTASQVKQVYTGGAVRFGQ